MARRARENPSAGVWIAGLFGLAAVGGVAYVLTRPKAAPAVASGGDAATLTSGGYDASTPAGSATAKAVTLAKLNHPIEGATWAATARANNPTPAELAALTAVGL